MVHEFTSRPALHDISIIIKTWYTTVGLLGTNRSDISLVPKYKMKENLPIRDKIFLYYSFFSHKPEQSRPEHGKYLCLVWGTVSNPIKRRVFLTVCKCLQSVLFIWHVHIVVYLNLHFCAHLISFIRFSPTYLKTTFVNGGGRARVEACAEDWRRRRKSFAQFQLQ